MSSGGGLECQGKSSGGDHGLDLFAGENLFEIIKLVDLDATENDEVGLAGAGHMPAEFFVNVTSQCDLLASQRNECAGEIPVRGSKTLVDVYVGEQVADGVDVVGQPWSHVGDRFIVGLPQCPLERVAAGVFEDGNGAVWQTGHFVSSCCQHVTGLVIEPLFDKCDGVIAANLRWQQGVQVTGNRFQGHLGVASPMSVNQLHPTPSATMGQRVNQ